MKKLIVLLTFISILFAPIEMKAEQINSEQTKEAIPESFVTNVKSALLIERDTGEILFEQDAHKRLPPASLTKIMTLLLVMESIAEEKLTTDEIVTVSKRAASMGGSQVFLAEGEQISVDDLIKAVAIASANDASVALAERIAGSEEDFVQKMNEKANQLQLTNTNFVNSSGLPSENHYTSAYDIAIMSKELLAYEDITSYTSIYEDYLRKGQENEFWLVNTNKLVHFSSIVDGLKTGYTKEAQYCLAATAEQQDMRVITVIMGATSAKERNSMTMDLINYAYNHYEIENLFEKGDKVAEYENLKSQKQVYPIKTPHRLSVIHKKGEDDSDYYSEIELYEDKELPIEAGEEIGRLIVYKDGKKNGESILQTGERIEFGSFFTLMKRSWKHLAKFE